VLTGAVVKGSVNPSMALVGVSLRARVGNDSLPRVLSAADWTLGSIPETVGSQPAVHPFPAAGQDPTVRQQIASASSRV
jgi:hypothetical protein